MADLSEDGLIVYTVSQKQLYSRPILVRRSKNIFIYVSVQKSEQADILLDPLAIGFSRAMVQLVIDEERLLCL